MYSDECGNCIFFNKKKPGMSCMAYPDGIPEQIITGELSHREHTENDRGLLFVPIAPGMDQKTQMNKISQRGNSSIGRSINRLNHTIRSAKENKITTLK